MNTPLIDAFNDCLQRMENGMDMETCLKKYPQLADELRPLLITAQAAQHLGKQISPPEKARRKSRATFLQAAVYAQATSRNARSRATGPAFLRWRLALTALLTGILLFTAMSTVIVASAQKSLPGDPLYGVKILSENVRLWLAPSKDKPRLEEEFKLRRQNEQIQLTLTAEAKSRIPTLLPTPTPSALPPTQAIAPTHTPSPGITLSPPPAVTSPPDDNATTGENSAEGNERLSTEMPDGEEHPADEQISPSSPDGGTQIETPDDEEKGENNTQGSETADDKEKDENSKQGSEEEEHGKPTESHEHPLERTPTPTPSGDD